MLMDAPPPTRATSRHSAPAMTAPTAPKFDEAAVLRAQADELVRRAARVRTVAGRKQLQLWAQELRDKAEELERANPAHVTKH